ncbi:hypothetical protein LCGC14_0555900 [marine sediment metagenome]|uniref:Uncharacterized protein n=1 Tax=marine sediment metagenome TaxID=412755 RepID=A0A0F9RTJ7_9ZZZZ
MKKKDFKCTICGYKVIYNIKLESLTCSNCNTEYDKGIFRFSKKQKLGIYFKKYGFLLAVISSIYLIYLVYRILIY